MRKFLQFAVTLCVAVALISKVSNTETFSFSYILSVAQNTPRYQPVYLFESISLGDWGSFNFIRNALYELLTELDLIAWFGQQCFSAIKWILEILYKLFAEFFKFPNYSPTTPPQGGGGGRW